MVPTAASTAAERNRLIFKRDIDFLLNVHGKRAARSRIGLVRLSPRPVGQRIRPETHNIKDAFPYVGNKFILCYPRNCKICLRF